MLSDQPDTTAQKRGKSSAMQPPSEHVHMKHMDNSVTFVSQAIPRLLKAPAWVMMGLFACVYVAVVVAFAGLYYALGEQCFSLPHEGDEFGFASVVWLSVHT